jgi:dTDP-4-amino-4,6-dideoxygalactose transaminase
LFGQAAPIAELQAICRAHNLFLVEDCAQAIGATYHGRPVGGFGQTGCFSFYPTKNLGADGDGGMVVTRDAELARRLKMLRVHGIEKRYFHDLHGFNSRLDELQAAILRVKVKHLAVWNARRAAIAARYNTGLAGLPLELPAVGSSNNHIYHVYAFLTDQRDPLHRHLSENGVPCIIYYPQPLHLQKVYADCGWKPGDYPVAEAVSKRILPLPMYPELSDDQVDYVVAVIRKFFHR